jgi:hypothetical protein
LGFVKEKKIIKIINKKTELEKLERQERPDFCLKKNGRIILFLCG